MKSFTIETYIAFLNYTVNTNIEQIDLNEIEKVVNLLEMSPETVLWTFKCNLENIKLYEREHQDILEIKDNKLILNTWRYNNRYFCNEVEARYLHNKNSLFNISDAELFRTVYNSICK